MAVRVKRPPIGSRWRSSEMMADYEVIGWTDDYGGMVEAVRVGRIKRRILLFRPGDFGTRLVPADLR